MTEAVGDIPVGKIGEYEVSAYLQVLRDRGLKESTQKLYMSYLGRIVEYATGSNPVRRMGIRWNAIEEDRIFISLEDWKVIWDAAETPTERIVLSLGAKLGLRREEMVRLMVDDIGTKDILIRGKGHGQGKMASRPLPASVRNDIDGYLAIRQQIIQEAGEDRSNGHLLISASSRNLGYAVSVRTVDRQIDALRKRTGIYFTTHSLRRLYQTTLYDLGTDLNTIRQLMRHSSIETTVRCYIDARPARQADAAVRLADALG